DELGEVFPEGKTTEQYLELADQLVLQGKYNQAKTLYFYVRDRDTTNPHANSGLGVVAAALGLYDLSLQMLRQALAVAPNVPGYRANLAETLRRMGRLSEAEAELRAAISMSPRD